MADWLVSLLCVCRLTISFYLHFFVFVCTLFNLLIAFHFHEYTFNILNPFNPNLFSSSLSQHFPSIYFRQMHDEVSETENLRKNLAVERMIVEGCDILLDVNQVFVRQGELRAQKKFLIKTRKRKKNTHTQTLFIFSCSQFKLYMYQIYTINCKYQNYVCILNI